MLLIREIIAGKKCVIYADDQPQVLLIQPVGEHENATLDAEIEAIREAVHVPGKKNSRRGMTRISLRDNRLETMLLRHWALLRSN